MAGGGTSYVRRYLQICLSLFSLLLPVFSASGTELDIHVSHTEECLAYG